MSTASMHGDAPAPASASAPAWHALTPAEASAHLATDVRAGLGDALVAERAAIHGRNELETRPPVKDVILLARQFTSPLITILLAATIVTLLLREFADASVIIVVLMLNATIGFTQERRADRSVHALMSLASPTATVVRQGERRRIDARELVPGDLVSLEAGDRVPADLRAIDAHELRVDESLLTGESEPTSKHTAPVDATLLPADRTCMLHMGSSIVAGRGQGLVVATAAGTVLGDIAAQMAAQERPPTPLQSRMARFANIVAVAVLASTLAAFGLGVLLGEAPSTMFLTAVALAVAVVPEGLPVAFTIAMALGVRRMARRNVIVRTLPAVETLGSTRVIGSDKTGTLTQNRMTVVAAWTTEGWFHLGSGSEPIDPTSESLAEHAGPGRSDPATRALRTGVLANAADLIRAAADTPAASKSPSHPRSPDSPASPASPTTLTPTPFGDPTETALLEASLRCGLHPDDIRRSATILAETPFSADLRYSAVLVDESGPVLRLKGAPERVVELCDTIATTDGDRPIDPAEVLAAAARLASRGLRVLAFAERRLPSDTDLRLVPSPQHLTLTGLIGMQDPPRHGVRDALADCRSAGIRVLMITGDHPVTARAIGADLGMLSDAESAEGVVTGDQVEGMGAEELERAVRHTAVFARVTPEHKLRIVLALQRHGDVVAVTGDGVNDAPALKAADIGVAMGKAGTDVAREASDMVLTDDDFVAIVAAVEEGRVVFDNVRKVTYFLLSTGMASIVAIIASIAMGLPLPYAPAALLWLNVVTNGLQDVALAFEPAEPDVLARPPRSRREGIVSRALWQRTVLTGTALAIGSLWLYTWAIDRGLEPGAQRGVALTTFVVAMAAHAYNVRSERASIISIDPRSNPFLLAAVIGGLVLHVAALYWPPTQALLRIAPFGADAWGRMLLVAGAVVALSEGHKWLQRRGSIDGPVEPVPVL